jgi:hypothetical protein
MSWIENPPGHPLSEEDIERGRVFLVKDRPEAKYRWTTGRAMGRFLDGLRQGKLVASRCPAKCGRTLFPPRAFCELDFVPVEEFLEVEDTGTLETYSISYLDTDARRIEVPIIVGVISIDGASPKMGMMHYIGDVDKEDVHIGMKVKAVWRPPEQRTGAVTDIAHFRPLEGEGV